MDKLEIISNLYAQTYKRRYLPMRILIPFMKIMERKANQMLEKNKVKYIQRAITGEPQEGLIVSLTSFPGRINEVWKTIVSIKSQSVLPEKIILWLSEDEFKDRSLPNDLEAMQDSLFEICWIKGNLRSHNKYYHAVLNFPGYRIITMDDDEYYHKDVIKRLVDTSEEYPDSVIANWVIPIRKKGGSLLPYLEWKYRKIGKKDKDLFQLGVRGVLYPPGSLNEKVLDKELIVKLTPKADDIWLNAMTRLAHTPVVYTGWKFRNIPLSEETGSLTEINCAGGYNDIQLKNLREYFIQEYHTDIYADVEEEV